MIRTEEKTPGWIYELAKIAADGVDPVPVPVLQCKPLKAMHKVVYTHKPEYEQMYERVGDLFPVGLVNTRTEQSVYVEYHDHYKFERPTWTEPWEYADPFHPGHHHFANVLDVSIYRVEATPTSVVHYLIFRDLDTAEFYATYTWFFNVRM